MPVFRLVLDYLVCGFGVFCSILLVNLKVEKRRYVQEGVNYNFTFSTITMVAEESACTITDVRFKRNDFHPMIVSFQNGVLRPDSAEGFECRVSIDRQNGGKRTVEVSSGGDIAYRGSEPPHGHKICRTMLAVRNKRTNQIRMIEVDNVLLAPVLPDSLPAANDSVLSVEQSFSALNKTFGSKRVKRQTELKERMMFEVNTMANQLNQAVSGVEINKEELVMTTSPDSIDSLVPCNRQAESVDEVYKLEDFISQHELDTLHEEAERVLNNIESCTEKEYSKYFCHQLKNLSADDKLQAVKILLYAECLLQFYCFPIGPICKKNFVICPYSEVINSKIMEKFTTMSKNRRSRPLSLLDRILCHVIILSILTNNEYMINIEPLIQSHIKIKAVRVQELCRLLGLQPVSKVDRNIVALKLPLIVPLPSQPRKRKRM